MLMKEVFYALYGVENGLFDRNLVDGAVVLKINPNSPLVLSSEICLLEEVASFGNHVLAIEFFIRKHLDSSFVFEATENVTSSYYLTALCRGLEDILQPYYNQVTYYESRSLHDHSVTIPFVLSMLDPYRILFAYLLKLIFKIEANYADYSDVRLLSLVYLHSRTGVKEVADAMRKIITHVIQIFLNQTVHWISGNHTNDCLAGYIIINKNNEHFHVNKKFIHTDLLSTCSAKNIFYIGNSVHILRSKRAKNVMEKELNLFIENSREKLLNLSADTLLKEPQVFADIIHHMSQEITKQFWEKILMKVDLELSFQTMKDIFLMSRGEIFISLLDKIESKHFRRYLQSENVSYELNNQFALCLEELGINNDFYTETLNIVGEIVSLNKGKKVVKRIDYSKIEIHYSPPWPISMIFNKGVLSVLNNLFIFLFLLKRAGVYLHECWFGYLKSKSKKPLEHWITIKKMLFLVNCLQDYIQVDVIEARYKELIDGIKGNSEIPRMKETLLSFLDSVSTESFQKSLKLREITFQLLNFCVNTAKEVVTKDGSCIEITAERAAALDGDFEKLQGLLLRLLYSYGVNSSISSSAMQLLLRLDYNNFYTRDGNATLDDKSFEIPKIKDNEVKSSSVNASAVDYDVISIYDRSYQ